MVPIFAAVCVIFLPVFFFLLCICSQHADEIRADVCIYHMHAAMGILFSRPGVPSVCNSQHCTAIQQMISLSPAIGLPRDHLVSIRNSFSIGFLSAAFQHSFTAHRRKFNFQVTILIEYVPWRGGGFGEKISAAFSRPHWWTRCALRTECPCRQIDTRRKFNYGPNGTRQPAKRRVYRGHSISMVMDYVPTSSDCFRGDA